jgi:hypothetical protein
MLTKHAMKFVRSNSVCRLNHAGYIYSSRFLSVKVGDKVPIKIMNDDQDPVIKSIDEYPEWLKDAAEPLLPLSKLQAKWKEDPDSMTEEELQLFSRRITLQQIRDKASTE